MYLCTIKYGRINERNIGHWTLDSEPKKRKRKSSKDDTIETILTEKEEIIKDLIRSHNSNYYAYMPFNLNNKFLKELFNKNIIEKGIRESQYEFFEDIEICKIVDIEKLKNYKL